MLEPLTVRYRLVVFALLALCFARPIFDQAQTMNVFHDAQFLSAYEANAVMSLKHFGSWLTWDPYSCGGFYALAAPQVRSFSPTILFSLFLGVDAANAFMAFLFPWLGMEGMYRLLTARKVSSLGALLLAPTFPLCAFFGYIWQWGWIQFYAFELIPWLLLGLHLMLRNIRSGFVIFAISFAFIIAFAGTYTLPMFALFVPFFFLEAVCERRSWRKPFFPLMMGATLAVALASYRLLPQVEEMLRAPRIMAGEPGFSYDDLVPYLFGVLSAENGETGSHTLGAICILGLLALWKHHWVGLATIVAFLLAQGHQEHLFAALRALPLYDTLRYPQRYLIFVVLFASILSAHGADKILPYKIGKVITLLLVMMGLTHTVHNAHEFIKRVQTKPSPTVVSHGFKQSRGNRWVMREFMPLGLGSLSCGEAYPVPMSRFLEGHLSQEANLLRARGQVKQLSWAPTAHAYAVTLAEANTVIINQNFHVGWTSNLGQIRSHLGRIAVDLPPGHHHLEIRFNPWSMWYGLASSILAMLALWKWNQSAFKFAALLPWLAYAFVPGSFSKRDPPYDAQGHALTDSQHQETRTTRFEVPIQFGSLRIKEQSSNDLGQELELTLWMKRTGNLSSSLGVFVAVMNQNHRITQGDHPEASSLIYLKQLPLNEWTRDTFTIPKPSLPITHFEVGLWNAYGNGARIHVKSTDHSVKNDAVVYPMQLFQ